MREHDREHEMRRRWDPSVFQPLLYPAVLVVVVIAAIAFVFWLARDMGKGSIGQFYGQAKELEP